MNQITKKTTSKLVSIQSLKTFTYPSNNKLSKIVKLLIKRLLLGRASLKTKKTIHFIVNITIFESLLFEGYSCKRLQTLYTY
jgi:hypothetical protein